MFTGIIKATAPIIKIIKKEDFHVHIMKFIPELLIGLETGASVAHNGCCLTVTNIEDEKVSFDLIKETLNLTNLGNLKVGDSVNIERAAKFNDEIGGHIISGHIITTAEIIKIFNSKFNCQIWLHINNPNIMKLIFYKGYIAIDGISLTIGNINKKSFCLNLIPETLSRTTFGEKRIGDLVNIEIDQQTKIIINTVKEFLKQKNN
ncbi:Riboflavin synthase [Candidatus Providencia siddallii]|uniref:Riboflavin synthase n=1 Tax=Candidatus Providencia siddallii TaxID=1715285 RepID=A0A0M6W7W2_9GAMM|nr:Riboflavin synthase [Candidatus Providencia siddallii]